MMNTKKLDKNLIRDIFALTSMQEGMLFHYLKEPDSDYYIEQLCLDLNGEVDRDAFKMAWETVVKNNEMLRVVFRWEKTAAPMQVVLKEHSPELKWHDLTEPETGQDKQGRLAPESIDEKERTGQMDLQRVPFKVALCKIADRRYRMIMTNHHILYDGWSNGIILKEFFQAYRDAVRGAEQPAHRKTGFKEFVTTVASMNRAEQEIWWRDYLRGFETLTPLPLKQPKSDISTPGRFSTATHQTGFDAHLSNRITAFVNQQKVTAASLLYSAWGILLGIYNNSDDAVFGTTVAGRSVNVPGIENMVGLMINTVPLRIGTEQTGNRAELIKLTDNALKERGAYENTPLNRYRGLQ